MTSLSVRVLGREVFAIDLSRPVDQLVEEPEEPDVESVVAEQSHLGGDFTFGFGVNQVTDEPVITAGTRD